MLQQPNPCPDPCVRVQIHLIPPLQSNYRVRADRPTRTSRQPPAQKKQKKRKALRKLSDTHPIPRLPRICARPPRGVHNSAVLCISNPTPLAGPIATAERHFSPPPHLRRDLPTPDLRHSCDRPPSPYSTLRVAAL
ncbi:hypothetical protein M6B38_242990 [Iris pallida]|uniref:Uncharacterized protein n=1 Tax=Iris pallida TaxID=29817 RepID=A0AAX6DJU6_IRIPA|nr:hypothetical protein M6B38_242990 [Iris pallida]